MNKTFSVTLIDPCPNATITPASPGNFPYLVTSPAVNASLAFTSNVSDSVCGNFSYTLSDANNNALDSQLFTFSNPPALLVVNSTNHTKGSVTPYTIVVTGH
jgi:hypothetical protein